MDLTLHPWQLYFLILRQACCRSALGDEGRDSNRQMVRRRDRQTVAPVESHSIGTNWRRINRLRLGCFSFRKCKNLLHLPVGGVFWPYGS